jgi:hypothetical protein
MPATNTPAPTAAEPAPTEAPTSATGEPTEVADLDELAALVATSIGVTATVPTTGSLGIEGVAVFQLANPINETPLWLAYTYGLRNFDTNQVHVIALYTRAADAWQEVTRLQLAENGDPQNPAPAPDYLDKTGVTQVPIEPTLVWIQVEGGTGAHSGVYALYSFDGAALTLQVANFSPSPGTGRLEDLNGDGVQEVVINASDPYVFCYACGVALVQYTIFRWDGTQMIPVTISPLSNAPAEVQALNDEIVQLAQAGLWKDALAQIEAHSPLPTGDETFTWNMFNIRYNAEAKRAATVDDNTAYPLLEHIFYGDFEAAVDILRATGADAIFIADSPLISGTVAAGWETDLADRILAAVDPALALKPDLAAAHFLRGWATYLKTQDETAALPAVQQAATLAPDDVLYTKSVDFLGGE